ncbi:AAA family ATPase [Bradyrhizobium sp. 187]|nr:AAA family ATPase [Bradyrhizobium sp. 17]UPJ70036.1 AAA family ATPase [Bradyrhizobium sp. 187]
MLQEIKIAGCATYSVGGEKLAPLKQINFVFGTNGAGKTTISRIINDPASHASCTLTWQKGVALACRVYNRDFVERNFATQLPGIFTLGAAAAETLDKIDKAKAKSKILTMALRSWRTRWVQRTLRLVSGESSGRCARSSRQIAGRSRASTMPTSRRPLLACETRKRGSATRSWLNWQPTLPTSLNSAS